MAMCAVSAELVVVKEDSMLYGWAGFCVAGFHGVMYISSGSVQ